MFGFLKLPERCMLPGGGGELRETVKEKATGEVPKSENGEVGCSAHRTDLDVQQIGRAHV